MSAVILSHCHTLQMMDISPGNETLQSLITLCNSANKVIFIFLLLSFSLFLRWLRATQASATPLNWGGPDMCRPLQLWQRARAQLGKSPVSGITERQTERGGAEDWGGWASKRQTETRGSRGGGQAAVQRQTISGRGRRQRRWWWWLPPPWPHTG